MAATLGSDHSNNDDTIDAFVEVVDQWGNVEGNSTVATVSDSGTSSSEIAWSDVPTPVDNGVARAMAHDTEARYVQAKAFYEAVDDAIR